MTDHQGPFAGPRHRARGEPEMVFPGGVVANVVLLAAILVVVVVAIAVFGNRDERLSLAVNLVVVLALFVTAGVVALWERHASRRRADEPGDALPRVEQSRSRTNAELPVAQRADWTLPSRTFYLDARAQAGVHEGHRRRLRALAAAVTLFVFFAGAGTFISYVTHGTSHGCVDCGSTGGRLTSWGFLVVGWVSAVVIPWQIWRSRDDETR